LYGKEDLCTHGQNQITTQNCVEQERSNMLCLMGEKKACCPDGCGISAQLSFFLSFYTALLSGKDSES
jgi:hypothetical protein